MSASETALWRYSVIAPLLHVAPDAPLTDLARRLAAEPKQGPDGKPLALSPDTILRWYRRYRVSNLPGLENRPRSDRGTRRALDDEALALLLELADEHPEWTASAIHREAQDRLNRPLSIKAAYRLLRGHRRLRRAQSPTRRRPVGTPQMLWLADTMHGPAVYGTHRKKHKSYLIAFMDDASRAIMAAWFVLRDNIAALIPVLRMAVLARGRPARLLCDNGPNYRSKVLRTACATLGIHLVYASPYHPQSKARLERFFLTVRLVFFPTLPPFPTLETLNTLWAKFLASYHAKPHSSLSALAGKPTPPLSYYLTHLPDDIATVSEVALDALLVVEETRRVNRDGTLRVAGRIFEVDPALVGRRAVVRFNPADPRRVLYRSFADAQANFISASLIN